MKLSTYLVDLDGETADYDHRPDHPDGLPPGRRTRLIYQLVRSRPPSRRDFVDDGIDEGLHSEVRPAAGHHAPEMGRHDGGDRVQSFIHLASGHEVPSFLG